MKNWKDEQIVEHFKTLISQERKLKSEILIMINEIECRSIHIKAGYTSMFSYLTEEMKYSQGSAQRRVLSARLLRRVPELKQDLDEGTLNLTQISIVAQGLKQTKTTDKHEALKLCRQVQNLSVPETQRAVAVSLDLPLQQFEKTKLQKDNSLRIELTLTEEQAQELQKAKDLLSHIIPGANWSELITRLAKEYIKRKDPAREVRPYRRRSNQETGQALATTEVKTNDQVPIGTEASAYQRTIGPRRAKIQLSDLRVKYRLQRRKVTAPIEVPRGASVPRTSVQPRSSVTRASVQSGLIDTRASVYRVPIGTSAPKQRRPLNHAQRSHPHQPQ